MRCLFLFLATISGAQAQMAPMPKDSHTKMWNEMRDLSSLTFSEITTDGRFSACEMVFRYPIRDFRGLAGEPLLVHGSIAYWFFPQKLPVLSVKIQPTRFMADRKTGDVKQVFLNPATASFRLGSREIREYEASRFECEGKGACIGYAEMKNDLGLMKIVASVIPFDGALRFALTKNGMDLVMPLEELKSGNTSSERVRLDFSSCISKVIEATIDSLK
jgi:hypothetical protein